MRIFTFILLLIIHGYCSGQNFYSAALLFQLFGDYDDKSEIFFGDTTKPFQIDQYQLSFKGDSLTYMGGCSFELLKNGVIKTCEYKSVKILHHTSYWMFNKPPNHKYGDMVLCNKNGIPKRNHNFFHTSSTILENKDSIIDLTKWMINRKGDTSCQYMSRWVYRNDTLVEYWHGRVHCGNNTWESQVGLHKEKITYPSPGVINVWFNSYNGNGDEREISLREERNYDTIGRLTSIVWLTKKIDNIDSTEYRYFYKDRRLKRLEHWFDGRLIEYFEITQ